MNSSPITPVPRAPKHPLISWQFGVLKLVLLLMLGVALEKPSGSIAGQISLQQKNFGLASYDIKGNKVYALANGPRGSKNEVERGVWINPDGTYRIDHLPVGEYSLKLRATGYSTVFQSGIFVDEGKVTRQKVIAMDLLTPSVNIAAHNRVFTTRDAPHFWINASGANSAQVKIYKKDFLSLLKANEQPKSSDSSESSSNSEEGGSDTDPDKTPRLDISADLNIYKPSDVTVESLFKSDKPVEEMTRKLEMDYEDSAHAEFKLNHPLPAGDYIATAQVTNPNGDKDWNLLWFSVSDLGLIVKQDPEKTLVRAVDLVTLKPRAGVAINVIDHSSDAGFRELGKSTTGADGFALLKIPANPGSSSRDILAVGTQGQDHAYGGLWLWGGDSADRYRTYFYTERPVYRLGQTVYFKGIVRNVSGTELLSPKPGTTLTATIEDPDNSKIWEGKLTTNAHGSFNGTFDIPAEGKTGGYQVVLTYPDDTKVYQSFEVLQYRKPEYQVEVIPTTPMVVAGQKGKARIHATYFFGAPVRDARVKYSIYSAVDWSSRYKLMDRPDYYDYYDSWEGGTPDGGSGGDFISEGYAQTDANGDAMIEFDTREIKPPTDGPYSYDYMNRRYKIEAEVTDLSRMAVISSAYVSVPAGDFALFVEPKSYVEKAGQPISATCTAVDYNGKPIANKQVTLKVSRWLWDRNEYTYRGQQVVGQQVVTTNADGKAGASFTTNDSLPTDTYYVSAQASDAGGRTIYDQSSVWIASENSPYVLSGSDAQREPLSIKFDKAVYKPGEVAKAVISAPVSGNEGVEAIVAIESNVIQEYKLVPLKSTAQLIEIPLKSSYAPNVYLTVTFVGNKHQFYTHSEMLKVSPEEHFLKIAVQTDRQKYKPGETVKYTIQATYPDGKPAPNTELSLGVVDESIYSIRAEASEDIQRFFYKRRPNLVTTACSFPEQYTGGPDKIEPAVRKDFRDTAAWIPDITTNAQGIATADVKLPDNLTTWRATVRGIDMRADCGSTTNKILCTQDLILRLALPRFYTYGDQSSITAIVHNYTDRDQSVHLTLAPSEQFKIDRPLEQNINVPADKAQSFAWPVSIVQAGNGVLTVKAIGQTAGDALQRTISVRQLGIPAFSIKSGLLKDEQQSVELPVGVSGDAVKDSAKSQLSLAASSIGPVLGNFDALIDYPYGCTEQTMSRLMPSVVAMRLHKDLGVPIDPKMQSKFGKVYKLATQKLKDYQHGDGGWGWWKEDASNIYLTSLVLEGYNHLTKAGYSVEKQQVTNGLAWLAKAQPELLKQLNDPKLVRNTASAEATTDLARSVYTRALYGQRPDSAIANWAIANKGRMTPEALAYLAMGFEQSGNHALARQCYDHLIALANQSSTFLDWDHNAAMLKRMRTVLGLENNFDYDYSYRFTGAESTALGLRAVVAVDPQNSDRLESIKNWLLLQRSSDGWSNTKTTSTVFIALLDEELLQKAKGEASFKVAANLGPESLLDMIFNQANEYKPETVLPLPLTTPGQVTVTKNGPGRLYYNQLTTYTRQLKPGDAIAEKGAPDGLRLSRAFFRLEPSTVTSDGAIHFKAHRIDDGKIKAGETVLMKVFVEAPISLPYVIVEAALPSGAEVVNDGREDNMDSSSSSSDPYSGDWSPAWWTHQDILDDRIVFFCSSLPSGKSEFHTMVRMEMPGTYQVVPMSLQGMYTNNVRGYSQLDALQVSE